MRTVLLLMGTFMGSAGGNISYIDENQFNTFKSSWYKHTTREFCTGPNDEQLNNNIGKQYLALLFYQQRNVRHIK